MYSLPIVAGGGGSQSYPFAQLPPPKEIKCVYEY